MGNTGARERAGRKGSHYFLFFAIIAGICGLSLAIPYPGEPQSCDEDDLPALPEELPGYNSELMPEMIQDTEDIYKKSQCTARRYTAQHTGQAVDVLVLVSRVVTDFHQPERCSNAQGWWTLERKELDFPLNDKQGTVLPLSYFISEKKAEKITGIMCFWYRKSDKPVRGMADVSYSWRLEYRIKRGKVDPMQFCRFGTILAPNESVDDGLRRLKKMISMLYDYTTRPRRLSSTPESEG